MKHRFLTGAIAATVLVTVGCSAPIQTPPGAATVVSSTAAIGPGGKPAFSLFAALELEAERRRNISSLNETYVQPVSFTEDGVRQHELAVMMPQGLFSQVSFSAPEQTTSQAYALQAANEDALMPKVQAESREVRLFAARHPGRRSGYRVQQVAGPTVGDVQTFNVANYEAFGGYNQVEAEMVALGPHCYVYVDRTMLAADTPEQAARAQLVRERATALGEAFDTRIYPTNTKHFGSLADLNNDVDGDPRVYIHITDTLNNTMIAGYFAYLDQVTPESAAEDYYAPPEDLAFSNQKDIVFLRGAELTLSAHEVAIKGTLAHEFQHLQGYHQKFRKARSQTLEEGWITECLSMNAAEVNGYGLLDANSGLWGQVDRFLSAPATTAMQDFNTVSAYGAGLLFTTYLVERFGQGIMREIATSREVGRGQFDRVLARYHSSYREVFTDFALAVLLDGRVSHERYQFKKYALGAMNTPSQGEPYPIPAVYKQPFSGVAGSTKVFSGGSMSYFTLGTGPTMPAFDVTAAGSVKIQVPPLLLP